MRKMMFNDRYGLTAAVIQKAKWKTRRIAGRVVRQWEIVEELSGILGNPTQRELTLKEFALKTCPIKVCDIIAVAQSYKDCGYEIRHDASGCERILIDDSHHPYIRWHNIPMSAAWENKMFVKACQSESKLLELILNVCRIFRMMIVLPRESISAMMLSNLA